ncbi:MAG: acyl carrier protein [Sphaerochaetaceae bacterium]|nr:acyl carrier protein [Sphaerochaetaceae bacterium]
MTEFETKALSEIVNLIADRLGCDKTTITAESNFHDIGIDSLDTVEILMDLEDRLGMSIEVDQKISTVGELAAFIASKH